MSLPPRGGPWELMVGVPDANKDRTRGRVQVCLFPLAAALGRNYLILSRFQVFSGRAEGENLGIFKSGDEFEPITAGHVGAG